SPTRMSASSTRAVSIRTGTGRSAWIRRHTSCPSYPGSITSSTTRSDACSPYAATAPGPSYARTTSYPSAASRSETAWLITGSSSTTRIRRLALVMHEGYERERPEIGATCGGSVQVCLAGTRSSEVGAGVGAAVVHVGRVAGGVPVEERQEAVQPRLALAGDQGVTRVLDQLPAL